jgi:magnesium transporter
MGLALGLTLGTIGFLRGAATPEDVRGNLTQCKEAFEVRVPKEAVLSTRADGRLELPKGSVQSSRLDRNLQIIVPDGQQVQTHEENGTLVYHFPTDCQTRTEDVSRWSLALVIAQAVAAICVWGTLVGSMLPLIFKRLGVDPGIASSPFVATFVDVTGIIIYFTIAKLYFNL